MVSINSVLHFSRKCIKLWFAFVVWCVCGSTATDNLSYIVNAGNDGSFFICFPFFMFSPYFVRMRCTTDQLLLNTIAPIVQLSLRLLNDVSFRASRFCLCTQVIHISSIIAAAAQFSRSANGMMEIVFISIKIFKCLLSGKNSWTGCWKWRKIIYFFH